MSDQETQELTIVEGRIGDALLAKYDPKQYHVIVPTHVITIPEEIMELGVSVVPLSPNPRDGMVYPFPEAGQGMMGLGKKAVEAISNAAGLNDEGSDMVAFEPGRYAIARATVSVNLPTGEVIRRTRSKQIDVVSRMEEYEHGLRDRIEKGKVSACKRRGNETDEQFGERREQYVEERCTKRRLQLQKFLWELADTGAHLRAMRALLPSLRETYHVNELRQPFIVPRISIRPAVASNEFLAAAMKSRARRDLHHLFGDEDIYEDLEPDLAAELRERDALLAEIAEEVESGELLREAADGKGGTDGWQVLQEAYGDGATPIEVTVIGSDEAPSETGKWPKRPWDAETLKRYLDIEKVAQYRGKPGPPSEKQLDYARSSLNQVAPDDPDRHTVTLYLFGVESSGDLTAAQCSALIDWVGAKPPDYEASPEAVKETRGIIEQYQREKGQTEMAL
jgi:hypothetical protein